MKIMLTGAGGQLGRALQTELAGEQLVALSHTELDITLLENVISAVEHHRPDVVINAAAFNDVDGAETAAATAFGLNAEAPGNLAIATQARGAHIVHISTDYVFDGLSGEPYDEEVPPNPLSVYGASKLAGERAVALHNPRHFIVRTAWLYGTKGKNFARAMLSLAGRDEVSVVCDRYGSPTYAPHLAEAIANLITTEGFGTYHLAGCGQASWFSLTKRLFKHFGIATRVKAVPSSAFKQRARRPAYSVLTTLRNPPLVLPCWEDGIQEFAESMLARHTVVS